jgi:hypothetical protein
MTFVGTQAAAGGALHRTVGGDTQH